MMRTSKERRQIVEEIISASFVVDGPVLCSPAVGSDGDFLSLASCGMPLPRCKQFSDIL
jgi:hypothetical protein